MKIENPREEYLKQVEALNMIETQLAWTLKEADKLVDQPGSPAANEVVVRFYALYRDFLKVKTDIFAMALRFENGQFADDILAQVFRSNANWLARKTLNGTFAQFVKVAETGDLSKTLGQ